MPIPTQTAGSPARSAASGAENSPTSCSTTSGANDAHSASTPGSDARTSIPAKTSVATSRLPSSSPSAWARAMTALRSSRGASANVTAS